MNGSLASPRAPAENSAVGPGVGAADMPLQTTVIGALPKPDYVVLRDWSDYQPDTKTHSFGEITREHNNLRVCLNENQNSFSEELEQSLRRAAKEVIKLQENCGIDVITDGEVRRENYIYYFLRHLKGFDFENFNEEQTRDGAWKGLFPTVVGEIVPMVGNPWVCREWLLSQSYANKPVKITLSEPLTIVSSVAKLPN